MTLEIRSRGSEAMQRNYRTSIEPILSRIRGSQSGKLLLTWIETSPRRVKIVPFGRRDLRALGRNNAHAVAIGSGAGTFGNGAPARGSGSEIHFSAGTLSGCGIQGQPDEILFHELCHSLRQITGTERFARNRQNAVPMSGGFHNVEEFFACMVASVYSSERGRPPVGNHGWSGLRNPEVLRRRPFSTRLREFQTRLPSFIRTMSRIPKSRAVFNPFRDYLDEQSGQE